MRLPKFTSIANDKNITFDKTYKKLYLSDIDPFKMSLVDYDNSKKLFSTIKKIESLIRQSPEYKKYIGYLKNEIELTQCNFFSNIDIAEIDKVGIEFHHYPYTLFDITETVLSKHTSHFTTNFNSFAVAEEVMRIHFDNMVGLVPLTKTVHELAHSGDIFIRLQDVFGDYNFFTKKYKEHINTELQEKLETLVLLSTDKEYTDQDNVVLDKSFQYIMNENYAHIVKVEPVANETNNIA